MDETKNTKKADNATYETCVWCDATVVTGSSCESVGEVANCKTASKVYNVPTAKEQDKSNNKKPK